VSGHAAAAPPSSVINHVLEANEFFLDAGATNLEVTKARST
jgi:hypothetical protein